ncbi:MAG: orotate phosphoribosyltransferase [Candidatus Micrarchaeota archaeon]
MNLSFIEFLAKNGAMRFGEFTLKSGRISPYFIDMGALTSGETISDLGRYYASRIHEVYGDKFDVIFGPAYKAIPIAISTAIELKYLHRMNKKWLFDRKEMKLHGADANSVFVGSQNIDHGERIVIVDDVLTTGGTKVEAIEKLEKVLKAEVVGIVIAVDRKEIGRRISALEEFSQETGVPVHPIIDIHMSFNHLKNRQIDGKVYVNDKIFDKYKEYTAKYGAKS